MITLLLPTYCTTIKIAVFCQILIIQEILEFKLMYLYHKLPAIAVNINCGLFLIKCLQILSNFAYIWGVSLRLPDLACPIEVGRPYLHLLADHRACRLRRSWWWRRWRLRMRSRWLHQRREFSHRRIRCRYLW